MKSSDRKIGYDMLRIFACFGVIMNHSILIYDQYGIISTWKWFIVMALFCLCKTAVTIFLLLSASLLLNKEEGYRDWFKKRIVRILFVLFVWSIIYFLQKNGIESCSLFHIVFIFIEKESSLHLWYLYMFIGICIMLPFLRKMVIKMNNQDWKVFIIIWLILGGFIPYYNAFNPEYPLILNPYFSSVFLSGYVAIYVIGYKIDSLKITKRRLIIAIIIFLTSWTANIIGTYFVSMRNHSATRNFDSPIILPVVLSACATLYIAKCINEYWEKKQKILFTFIIELSKCTFGIYLVHPLILDWIWSHDTNPLYIKFLSNYTTSIHQFLLINVIVFILSAIIVYIMKKSSFLKFII